MVSRRPTAFPYSVHSDRPHVQFLGQVPQEKSVFYHWLAGAFESHLMFARLQGSPLEVLCDVMCDVRAEVTQAGRQEEGGRQADEASQKCVKSTDICRTLLPRAEVQGLYICKPKYKLVLYVIMATPNACWCAFFLYVLQMTARLVICVCHFFCRRFERSP